MPHEDIIDKLVEWKPGMGGVLFVSHTCSNSHPDPHGTKLKLVQRLVRRMRSKASQSIEARNCGGLVWQAGARDGCDAPLRYLWIDFLSVPQRNPAAQNLAIQSIFSSCTMRRSSWAWRSWRTRRAASGATQAVDAPRVVPARDARECALALGQAGRPR